MPRCGLPMRRASSSTCAASQRRMRLRCRSWLDWAWMSSAWRPRAWVRCVGGSADWTLLPVVLIRRGCYSTSPLTQPESASNAAGASSPSALRCRTVPPVAPRASTARMLLAFATLPSRPTVSCDRNCSAILTKVAAGRAWSATPAGSATMDSKLARTAAPLVPSLPSGPPPAGSTFTSAPATWEARSASPRASSRLWETSTIPTKFDTPQLGSMSLDIAFPTTAVVYTTDRNSAMPNDEKVRRSSIQSIDRATAILKALASGPRRLGVSELADRLGLARPTVHGLLQTLQAHGFVEQDRHSDKYQLGPGLLQLGYSYLDLNELRARSIGYADRLAERAGAAVRVGVMHGSSVVVVHHVFKPDSAFGVLEVGLQLPLHASSLGKAILAFSPDQTIEDLVADPLPRLTKRTLM